MLSGSSRRRAAALSHPRPTTPLDVLVSGALAFLIGYKLLGVALGEYSLQGGADTQRYLLSSKGHSVGRHRLRRRVDGVQVPRAALLAREP